MEYHTLQQARLASMAALEESMARELAAQFARDIGSIIAQEGQKGLDTIMVELFDGRGDVLVDILTLLPKFLEAYSPEVLAMARSLHQNLDLAFPPSRPEFPDHLEAGGSTSPVHSLHSPVSFQPAYEFPSHSAPADSPPRSFSPMAGVSSFLPRATSQEQEAGLAHTPETLPPQNAISGPSRLPWSSFAENPAVETPARPETPLLEDAMATSLFSAASIPKPSNGEEQKKKKRMDKGTGAGKKPKKRIPGF
jgi:hypothetical protein